jgi:hypothetical protein
LGWEDRETNNGKKLLFRGYEDMARIDPLTGLLNPKANPFF